MAVKELSKYSKKKQITKVILHLCDGENYVSLSI